MTMQTGAFWNTSNPAKPWGLFDPDAKLVFPISWADWATDMGVAIRECLLLANPVFELAKPLQVIEGVAFIRLQIKAGAVYEPGDKYPFTCRAIAMDDQQDDRTFWLKVGDR